MPESTMYWDGFRITVSFAMDCPFCHAKIQPWVEHACSNPKPKASSKPAKRVRAKRNA
jgi:hypothetical protein